MDSLMASADLTADSVIRVGKHCSPPLKRNVMRLDIRDRFPSGMEEYLSQNGWHFNKNMCDWATGMMYKKNGNNKEKITGYTKGDLDNLFTNNGLGNNITHIYDAVYVANMCKTDFLGSSIPDDRHLAKFVQDYVQDADGYEEMPFTRFYADCIGKGLAVPWEDML